jgi:hypothetical protein
MIEQTNRIPVGTIDPMILDIFPSDNFEYTFREDEGETEFVGKTTENGLELSWKGPISRTFIKRLHTWMRPQNITLISPAGMEELNWRDIGDGVLQIEVPELDYGKVEVRR